ncbi:MAG: valine--tRNA ligase [Myxococcota bacterium]
MELPKHYDPHSAYEKYYSRWEEIGCFTADPTQDGDAFTIVIPPPNVTGSLHMGHALNNTLQDIMVRYKRMDGFNVLWLPGTDHAGIATQWVVEKQLRKEGISRVEMGREAFEKKVWSWKEECGNDIINQLRHLGVSCDWSRQRFTLDNGLSKAVREVFVTLYEQGLIYRAERLINWDPHSRTALSNLEVIPEEDHQAELWSFAYELVDPIKCADGEMRTEIVVATTRPETMLGDTAVAVHPEDKRYTELIGTFVKHPFINRPIPIIADAELVDPEFGTGAVKITPAHDFNDFEVGQRHGLPMINIMNPDGSMNSEAGPFEGLDRFDARKAVKAKIEALGLFRGTKPHLMALPRSERSGVPVEPMLSTQWFVKMQPLAKPAIEAVEQGDTRFIPKQWENTYFSWLRDIRDWCISRQLWWGHRIPAWYCDDCGHVTVSRENAGACESCGSGAIRQDEDVLDTWFSSALWPFSTMGWPDNTADLQKYYPTSVLVTGFDIIFFWVARMMFSGLHFTGQTPFKDVYIHALVRDEHGQKMSKTKGNVVNPLDQIEKIGVDAFRMTLTALAVQGRDILWSEQRAETYVKFQNKIWQAFRFLEIHLKEYDPSAPVEYRLYDNWIRARAGVAIRNVREALDEYRFNDAAIEIYTFVWNELCDWYLEFSKGTLYNKDEVAYQAGARKTLIDIFSMVARLMHPIMPFLSAEIWSNLPTAKGEIMLAPYPKAEDFPIDDESVAEVGFIQKVISEIRRVRSELQIAFSIPMKIRAEQTDILHKHAIGLKELARVDEIHKGGKEGVCATVVVDGQNIYIPLSNVIDLDEERARLDKQIQKTEKDLGFLDKKLGNEKFTSRAPAHIIDGFKVKRDAAAEKLVLLKHARLELEG